MATSSFRAYQGPHYSQRRVRPTTLSNTDLTQLPRRPHPYKMHHPYKIAPTHQYSAPASTQHHNKDWNDFGNYVLINGAKIGEDLYLALNLMENKTYVSKMVHKKDCHRVLSKYKDISHSTVLPHIHEIISKDNSVLLVLDLHPYFDSLPQTAVQEKAQKFAKEILELVNKLHESGISPHKMTIDDFTQYKETPTSIGYHLQMMKLDESLMLSNCDEELADIDACSSPELVNIIASQKNKANPMDIESGQSLSRSKLEAIHNYGLDLEKADSWRVGALIYTMIAGRTPFPDPLTETQNYFEAIGQLKPPTKKTSRNAWEFLLGLLEPDPEERLSITQALEHPWLQEYALRTESHAMLSSKEEHKLPSNPSSPTY